MTGIRDVYIVLLPDGSELHCRPVQIFDADRPRCSRHLMDDSPTYGLRFGAAASAEGGCGVRHCDCHEKLRDTCRGHVFA